MLPSLKNCPDCGSSLGKSAYKCRCGWKGATAAEPQRLIECAHFGCPNPAIVRVVRAGVCRKHYDAHWTPIDIDADYQVKPSTPHMEEVRAAYLKSHAYRHRDDYAIVPKRPVREPGQDDEERLAA